MRSSFYVVSLIFISVVSSACTEPDWDGHSQWQYGALTERESIVASGDYLVPSTSSLTPVDASDMAEAMGIPAAIVANALLESPHAEAALVLSELGVLSPVEGDSFVVMSTGLINLGHLPEPGTDIGAPGVAGDEVKLTVVVDVPVGANRMSFDFNFLSAESPDFVGSSFNDTFTARVSDSGGSREIARASVNSSFFFDASVTRAGGTGFDLLLVDDPAGVDQVFGPDLPPAIQLFPDAGITDFQTITAEVADGGQAAIEFIIHDLGDGILDSTVVIDNIHFSAIEAVDPNPSLILPFDGNITTNAQDLLQKGAPVRAVAADGVTPVLLRVATPEAGDITFSLVAGTAPADGGLGAVGTGDVLDSVTVATQMVSAGSHHSFAIYTSPIDFNTGGFAQDARRIVRIAADFVPTDGSGAFSDEIGLAVVRPPVVVVHDMWTGCAMWAGSSGIYASDRFRVTCADYTSGQCKVGADIYNMSPSEGLIENQCAVPGAILEAVDEMRDKGVAATQVDIIGHGMGGLLTRRYIDHPSNSRYDNFYQGSINRFISLNTPHLGMRMADEVVTMRTHVQTQDADPATLQKNWPKIRNSLIQLGIFVDEGTAVDELGTDSALINGIGETSVPSHALVGTGGLLLPRSQARLILFNAAKTLYFNMEFHHPQVQNEFNPLEKQKLILGPDSKIFCTDDHDLLITAYEQKGGLTGDEVTEFTVDSTIFTSGHFSVPGATAYDDRLAELLNTAVSSPAWASSIPSPGDVPRVNSCPASAMPPTSAMVSSAKASPSPQASLVIVSPSPGIPVIPGEPVMVTVEGQGGFQPQAILILAAGQAQFVETQPFMADFTVPVEAIGTFDMHAYAIDSSGTMLSANPVSLSVSTSSELLSMEVINGDTSLAEPGDSRKLLVLGTFEDGVKRGVANPGVGTVYSTSNAGLVQVSQDGTITGIAPGIATIVIRNGIVSTSISVTVLEVLPPDPCDLGPSLVGTTGDDALNGGADGDTIRGGDGMDHIHGGECHDRLYGDGDDDELDGGTGNDLMDGGEGNDELDGDEGDDTLYGGTGDDELDGDHGSDILFGGEGNDELDGDADQDELYGDAGDDNLDGDAGDDLVDGGPGNDWMHGAAGDDRLYGRDDDDVLIGDAGDDILDGGAGHDRAYYTGPASEYILTGNSDGSITLEDTVANRDGVDILLDIEEIRFESSLPWT